jgi:hypothetical protein
MRSFALAPVLLSLALPAAAGLQFNPIAPCRLIDTRGNGAPIQGGAFAPNTRRAYTPGGACGIPTSGVSSITATVITLNNTPNSGGFLAVLAPSAPISAVVDIFNIGSQWSASNVVSSSGSGGQFDIYVGGANAHVIMDVIGYHAATPDGSITNAMLATGSLPAVTFTYNHGTLVHTIQPSTGFTVYSSSCPVNQYPFSGSCSTNSSLMQLAAHGVDSAFARYSCGGYNLDAANTHDITISVNCITAPAASK